MIRPARMLSPWLAVGLVCSMLACQTESAPSGGVDDSTYVRVMGSLRRLHDDRLNNQLYPLPQPIGPGGRAPTPAQLKQRDSTQTARLDSVTRLDSTARAALLARYKVSPEQLMTTARALSKDPLHSQRVSEAVNRRAISLDSAARAAKARVIDSARADSVRKAVASAANAKRAP